MSVKLHYPATHRNREAIVEVLHPYLATAKSMLEIASGSGEHLEFFAPRYKACRFQPTDIEEDCLASIAERARECPSQNISPPLHLDARTGPWPPGPFDLVFNANMLHISPWECCEGLMRGASACLSDNGLLCLYGPFIRQSVETAVSNVDFDRSLRERNPDWGIRKLSEVENTAQVVGFSLSEVWEMPANNVVVIFQKDSISHHQ